MTEKELKTLYPIHYLEKYCISKNGFELAEFGATSEYRATLKFGPPDLHVLELFPELGITQ